MLSNRSKDFLELESNNNNNNSSVSNIDLQVQFIERHKFIQHENLTVATCMESIQTDKEMYDEYSRSQLVIGTESAHLYILNGAGTDVACKIQLPSVAVSIATIGAWESDYRIVVACRDGNVYTIKKGKLLGGNIECETQPIAVTIVDKNIIVACMDNTLHSYHFKGKKNYTLNFPAFITNLAPMRVRSKNVEAFLVSLSNGEIRIYRSKQHLVHTVNVDEVVTSMHFGSYGREENSLVLTFKSGGIMVKMLQRQANLDANISVHAIGPPPEQDVPLNIPKRTKLFVQQTQREIEQALEMHKIFQRDLCKIRLSTARAYVKIITSGQGPLSSLGGSQIRLDAKVQGLGPVFNLKLELRNSAANPVSDLMLLVTYNSLVYQIDNACVVVPCLIPNVSYFHEVMIESIDAGGAADAVRVFVTSKFSSLPMISAIVNMPMSEQLIQSS